MLSTLILYNQKGLARFNELACPLCKGIIEDKNINNLTCLNCNNVWKIHQLEIIPFEQRVPTSQKGIADDVFSLLGEKAFMEMILGSCEAGVIFKNGTYRFVGEYNIGKRLRWVKRYPQKNLLEKYEYELGLIRVGVPIARQEIYPLLLDLYSGLADAKTPNQKLKNNSSKYKKDYQKKEDPFMDNVVAMVSAFIRGYDNMYEKILSDDVTNEDFDKFQEMLDVGIADFEIQLLKNGDGISLSSLVPAIEYLLSKSIRPSVSLLKKSMKLNIINDLPSTHPFYDLFHEKPL